MALILAQVASVIACGVGVPFTSFWGYLVMAYLYGQIHRATVATVQERKSEKGRGPGG